MEEKQDGIIIKMNSSIRKICVYTSNRAEYGILRKLISKIDACSHFNLELLISGTHLVADQGMTIEEIKADGFKCYQCINIELSDDSPAGICNSMGLAISSYGKSLTQMQPDILVILGDRFEAFCCAAAAHICQVPISHIHGGETTEGAIDEAFRHSITKMAHLHFPCHEEYRQRIIQLGESPERVFNVGSLGEENIRKMVLLSRKNLEKSIDFKLNRSFFLITFHPVTLEKSTAGMQFGELLSALDKFPNHNCIFTQANADVDGKIINTMIYDYVGKYPERCIAFPSLGSSRYLSAMKLCDAVIGNSSSGILEAPVFKVPTVNIGDRQKGRVRQKSIIDCKSDKISIQNTIAKALSPVFKNSLNDMSIQNGPEDTSDLIIQHLLMADYNTLLKKTFYNLPH